MAHSITWQDTRTAAAADALAADGGIDRFRELTGLPISTYSSALKLRWLLDQEPTRRAAAERGDLLFGTPDTWLLWNLTGGPDGGVHATDPTNASRTLLMDLRTLDWDDEPARRDGDPARAASRDPLIQRGVRPGRRRAVRRARGRDPGRPAGVAVRSHLL